MILERTSLSASQGSVERPHVAEKPDQPLTCMIYFFASQMSRNIQTIPPSEQRSPTDRRPVPTHRLDSLLTRMGAHAAFSPLITHFETFPVEVPGPPGRRRSMPPRGSVHDTMLLMRFRSKRAREEWIESREWQEFMEKTENEGVFRRIPHVRCAGSLMGLRDPMEVLGI